MCPVTVTAEIDVKKRRCWGRELPALAGNGQDQQTSTSQNQKGETGQQDRRYSEELPGPAQGRSLPHHG